MDKIFWTFFFVTGMAPHRKSGATYALLLDIRMPKVDGIGVLKQVKSDPELRKLPLIIITTTDDPREVDHCYDLGCNGYISKPVEYDKFITTIRQLGLFLSVVQIPNINGEASNNGRGNRLPWDPRS